LTPDQILRHSRIAVTMEIYTEATSEATRNALKRLGEELTPAPPDGAEDHGDADDEPETDQPGQ
jgi:hypothetical protein